MGFMDILESLFRRLSPASLDDVDMITFLFWLLEQAAEMTLDICGLDFAPK